MVSDPQIDDWRRPWNVKSQHHVPDAPLGTPRATNRRSIDRISCVYIAQTFEYDWNAVSIGPELLWRDGRFSVGRSTSKDPAFRGAPDDIVERCIRNAYQVLLTRGMAGTVLYSHDARTQSVLRWLIPGTIGRQQIPGFPARLRCYGIY
ncbi:DNA/RNA helicase domain-containing protein [Streptomyces sp. NPDC012935]|uniref:DNA/RNA helicase domain-containing protein n=1 Tax=Streptomyces sp. NPDC012935 TaxID=3364857 RepID=UPI0036CA1E6A